MKSLVREKLKAIELRKRGLSYNEILKQVPVAKSSLSLWLKDLPLTQREKTVLKKRRNSNISRGRIKASAVLHTNRLKREEEWLKEARKDFILRRHEPLFHVGVSLYWAEGAKRSNQFLFVNTDKEMINVMLSWLERYTKYSRIDCGYRLFIHKLYAHEDCIGYWVEELHVPRTTFKLSVFKETRQTTKTRPQYKGCLRIEVPRSRELLCKMKFWKVMLVDSYLKE
jgi:hypothetical protein